ncbi:MAG: NAD(P)-binding domain-containing protein [Gemmatimonadaceae bacterium]|jgi:3-hydroxyisobutyrate dehydrogenase-like beta-hydroxyacid dehydrogenase|nr:NAD(P)-binding domain-containing protein [Gemmatimonadaceae bacterium]
MSTIAFLGTGLLGSGFVEAACARGETVRVWNRTATKAAALAAHGAVPCATPAEAVRGVERVHLVLRDDDSVDEVLAAARSALGAETIILDHTTTLPVRTAARAAALARDGVRYLHCPVFMAPAAARNRQGIILVAGPSALHAQVAEVLAGMTGRVEYLGERTDLAAVHKLLGNAMIVTMAGGFADVLAIAAASGVSAAEAQHLFTVFSPAGMITGARGTAMVKGDYTPSFELSMARKDVRLMMETAGAAGQPLAVLPGLAARMDALIARGFGERDSAVLSVDAVGEKAAVVR